MLSQFRIGVGRYTQTIAPTKCLSKQQFNALYLKI